MASLSVDLTIDGGRLDVVLIGELDIATASQIRSTVLPILVRGEVTSLQIRLHELHFIDSTGLGVLVNLHKRLVAAGGSRLRLVDPVARVARILQVTGLDRVFDIQTTDP